MLTSNQIIGTVSQVLYGNMSQQIIKLNTSRASVKVVIKNPDDLVELNDHIAVIGSFEHHSKYGEQFLATDISHCAVTQELIRSFLMSSNGIGEKTADKLIRRFKDNLVDLLERKDVDSLIEHNDVSKAAAELICRNWHKQAGKVQLVQFMEHVLQDTKPMQRAKLLTIGKRAFQYYGEKTAEKLREDPYRIWSFSNFKSAELLAKALCVPNEDERRIICALEDALFRQLDSGHTRCKPYLFIDDLTKLIGEELVSKALSIALDESKKEHPRIIVTEPENENLTATQKLHTSYFALPASVIMENYIKDQLLSRIKRGILNIQVTEEELDDYTISGGHKLSKEQQQAVKTVLSNPISCVSGGAGTGKTSVLFCAHEIITHAGNQVLQVALSGKASRRLAQQTEREAMTIEKLLKIVKWEPEYLDQFPSPLILIDEASMVDLHTMYRLLRILEGRPARLVFVGDRAQLPPVGPGLIYHKLMESNLVPRVELTENFRSIQDINNTAVDIKKGHTLESKKLVRIVNCENAKEMVEIAKREYEWNLSAKSLHVIAARTRTVSDINIKLHESITHTRRVIPSAPEFREGDAVVYKANNAELGIVNGSTGVVTGGNEDFIIVRFDIEGLVSIPKESIRNENAGEYLLQHGYALTCHSAQGSEFDVVIVVVEDMTMVERSWLYTAITRAKKKVILVTTNNSIQKAIDRGFAADQIEVGFEL
ncbi:MAG: AAA family ATPase [Aestuariibacter sp.]|nr:AAA family ATPase [Aestuariibacter sp.]